MPAPAPIVYFDIAGPSATKLREFYAKTLGWKYNSHQEITPESTGGLAGTIREDPPEKIIYFGVPDINKALVQIEAAGGKTVVPRTVVPKVVIFALFEDPAGNRQGLAEFGSYPDHKKKV